MFSQVTKWLMSNRMSVRICLAVVTILAGLVIAKTLSNVVTKIFVRLSIKIDKKRGLNSRRFHTYGLIISYIIKVIVIFISIVQFFSFLDMKSTVNSLFATAGISGIAISFGAQHLVKDVVSGLFMLMENQYSVGDFIKINNIKGYVHEFYPRTTIIRSETGELHTIPNGSITLSTNYSRGYITDSIDITISIESDPFVAMQLVKESVKEKFSSSNIDILGVSKASGEEYTLSFSYRCIVGKRDRTEREILECALKVFSENGIKLPGKVVPNIRLLSKL